MKTDLMPIGKVAKLFGVSGETIRRWEDEGALRGYRTFGGHRRYRAEEVGEIVARITQGGSRRSRAEWAAKIVDSLTPESHKERIRVGAESESES